jgi:ATP-dependent DNA ligase
MTKSKLQACAAAETRLHISICPPYQEMWSFTFLDQDGKPAFSVLQNYGSTGGSLHYFIFDVLILKDSDVMAETLVKRRELLEKHVFPKMSEPIRYSPVLEGGLKDLIQSVKAQGLEGLVAKRGDSLYEPGRRSGAWQKMRVNRGQEFVIGGYTMGGSSFDALVFGYYDGGELIYAARTGSGANSGEVRYRVRSAALVLSIGIRQRAPRSIVLTWLPCHRRACQS